MVSQSEFIARSFIATEYLRHASTPSQVEVTRQVGKLKGTLTEKGAEIARLKKALYEAEAETLQRRAKRSRPGALRGITYRLETPLGTTFTNITEDDKGPPFEVIIILGKAGGSAMADAEAMGRLISMALRSGIPIMEIHRQLRGISSDRVVGPGPNNVMSLPDAIGIVMERWNRDKQGVQQVLIADALAAPEVAPVVVRSSRGPAETQQEFGGFDNSQAFMGTCPDCGSQLEDAEGCVKCHVCGFSECG